MQKKIMEIIGRDLTIEEYEEQKENWRGENWNILTHQAIISHMKGILTPVQSTTSIIFSSTVQDVQETQVNSTSGPSDP